ncbi:MAG: flagellar hook-length control protein FliK, partial [Epsilonproteobacteria bacterium]|nr:flagellar hook-length control protein FliK [Campylobacterota bacterium]
MDVNTASLLANQLQTLDTKTSLETKETLTRQADALIQKSAQLPLELSSEKTAYAKTPSDAKEVVAQLLGSAISEAKSKSAIYEVLQKSQLFKNMGNFADDIKTLTTTVKLDSTIAQPMALLQLFTKNIDQIDTKMLQTQIQNSGIFFESKLA